MDRKDVDLPGLDPQIALLPEDIRRDLGERLSGDLYAFCKSVLGYGDMTPRAHGPICVFVDRNPAKKKAIAMPRDTFKSSVVTIGNNLRGVVRNPNETRLITNEVDTNAERFLGAIDRHVKQNKIFRALYSYVIPKDFRKVVWNSQSLEFNRDVIRPEPTVDALGIMSTATSRHYDHITFDDLISEKAIKSPTVMQDTTERALRYRPLMRHPDESTLTIVFTRWAFADTYNVMFKRIPGLAKLIRGAIEDDEPIFPEKLSLRVLAEIREEMGEYMFSCLYMNNPRNEEVQDFNVKDLKFWQWKSANPNSNFVELIDRDGQICDCWHLDQLDITATVDFAVAEKIKSDRNAISVCGISPKNQAISLESWAKRCNPLVLMSQIFDFHRRYQPRVWGLEEVQYQAAYKYFASDYADREGLYLRTQPIKAVGKKESRIRGLQPVAATGRLYVGAEQHILRTEMSEFPLGEHDDAIDSLSMHLQLWRGQMSDDRWKRYKASEVAVLEEINRQNLALGGAQVGNLPGEDFGDLRPAARISESTFG